MAKGRQLLQHRNAYKEKYPQMHVLRWYMEQSCACSCSLCVLHLEEFRRKLITVAAERHVDLKVYEALVRYGKGHLSYPS